MLHVENPLPGMQKILKPTTMLSFPSSYVRLPSTKDKQLWQNCGFAQDADGKRINEDFFDAQTWRKLELGPFAFGDVPREQLKHMENCLDCGKLFRRRLAGNYARLQYPPMTCILGDAEQTRSKVKFGGPKAVMGIDFKSVEWVFGDGRVSCDHAVPARGVRHEVQMCSRPHDDLANDKKTLSAVSQNIYQSVAAVKQVTERMTKKDAKRDVKRLEEEEARQHAEWEKFSLKRKEVRVPQAKPKRPKPETGKPKTERPNPTQFVKLTLSV